MNDAKQMVTEKDALEALREGINRVVGQRWMVCVWRVDKGAVDLAHRTTWDFPTGDFDVCMEQLKEALNEEKKATTPAVPPPLEIAKFLDTAAGPEGLVERRERRLEDETKYEILRCDKCGHEMMPGPGATKTCYTCDPEGVEASRRDCVQKVDEEKEVGDSTIDYEEPVVGDLKEQFEKQENEENR